MSRRSKSKRFFVKEEDGVYTVFDEFFNDIESREEALVIAMRTLGELHYTMQEESKLGECLFIGTMKVITGLQRCLDELEHRWPFLITEIHAIPRKINGHTISIC